MEYAKTRVHHDDAGWANRTDCYGGYYSRDGKTSQTTRKKTLDVETLQRHFAAKSANDLVGLHTTDPTDDTCRWFCVDIDAYDDGADADANDRSAAGLWYILVDLAFNPVLFQSNGAGGFHLFVFFSKPVRARDLCRFGRWLLTDAKLSAEFFPKQESVNGRYGNWVRLPGRHHTREHYSRAWSGEHWLDAEGTVKLILATEGDDPGVVTDPRYQLAPPHRDPLTVESSDDRLPLASETVELINDGAPVGERNGRLFKAACNLCGCGYTQDEATERLRPALFKAGLHTKEIVQTIQSAYSQTRTPTKLASDDDIRTAWDVDKPSKATATPAAALRAAPTPSPLWRSFPTNVLPEPLRSFVREGAAAMHVDESFVALPVLAVAASAIGTTRRARLKDTWTEPAGLWCVLIGRSGAIKSPPIELAVEPLTTRQADEFRVFESRKLSYENKLIEFECAMKDWRKNWTGDAPTRPEAPVPVRFLASDTTVEAMAVLLQTAPRGILLYRDELSSWLGSFDRYKNTTGSDVGDWLSMHRGGQLTVDRKGGSRPTIFVPQALVSICGSIQPKVLARALGAEHFENGLASRFLLTMPPHRPGRWSDDQLSNGLRDEYDSTVGKLLALNHLADLKPRDLDLTGDAHPAFRAFHDETEQQIDTMDDDLGAAFKKLKGAAARLALVIQLVRDPESEAVDADSINSGIKLARWFGGEAVRIYAALAESAARQRLREFAEFVAVRGGVMSLRDLQRTTTRFGKTAAEVRQLCVKAADAGYGAFARTEPTAAGGRPQDVFTIETPTRPMTAPP